jgi:hypothetical protein
LPKGRNNKNEFKKFKNKKKCYLPVSNSDSAEPEPEMPKDVKDIV